MDNEYKTICDVCGQKTWYEEEQQCHCVYTKKVTCKTCGHSEEVSPPKMARCNGRLRKIDNSELNEEFTPYYKSQERIEVEFTWGKTKETLRGNLTTKHPLENKRLWSVQKNAIENVETSLSQNPGINPLVELKLLQKGSAGLSSHHLSVCQEHPI